jgi:hypothetical protein
MESSKTDAASGVTHALAHGVAIDEGVAVATGVGVGETGTGVGVAPDTGEALGDGLGDGLGVGLDPGCPRCRPLLSVATVGSEPAPAPAPPHAGRASTAANASGKKKIGNRRFLSRNLNLIDSAKLRFLASCRSARHC